MLNYQKIGMEFLGLPASNYMLEKMIDNWVWFMMQMYYAPYRLPDQLGDVEKWTAQVSLNGARWSNICKPN
jgi:hypothetical protein